MLILTGMVHARPLPDGFREELFIAGGDLKVQRVKGSPGRFTVRINQRGAVEGGFFSWIIYDPQHGMSLQDGGQGKAAAELLDDAWGAMFGEEPAIALMTVARTPSKLKSWALELGRPRWDHVSHEWVLPAKSVGQLSPNLDESYPNARLRRSLTPGKYRGLSSLVIDNNSQTAHNQLGAGISSLLTEGSSKKRVAPECTMHQMSVEGVMKYIENRPDIQQAQSWSGSLNSLDKLAIAKSMTLPCDPRLDLTDPNTLPSNVKAIVSYLTREKWNELTTYAGKGDKAYDLPFDKAGFSYESFLKAAAMHPFFCGEKGSYDSIEEACKRELASIFAHAAQETGAHDKNPEAPDEWKQAFYFMREAGCWVSTQGCGRNYAPFKGDCPAPFYCPKDAGGFNQYWGRGIKQLSHYYNYAQFSAGWYGSDSYNELLTDADAVASDSLLAIASGLWFHMVGQPPKPSMHDVMVGAYHPLAAAQGIKTDDDGSVLDKFEASVSIINGAFECSPTDPTTIEKSKNRFAYYKGLLGYFKANLNEIENSYKTGETYCRLPIGNPFGDTNLATKVNVQYASDSRLNDGSCRVVSYGLGLPLQVAPEGMGDVCKQIPNP